MTTPTEFEVQIAALELRLGQAGGLVAEFDSELGNLGRTMTFTSREVDGLSRNFAGGLRRAFDGVVFDGMRLQDALRGTAQTMIDSVYNAAMKPVQNAFGGFLAQGVNGAMSSILKVFRCGPQHDVGGHELAAHVDKPRKEEAAGVLDWPMGKVC
ncbi:hypothetical protein M3N55_16360, partial [Roseibaca sp. V10]|nr:hypothetical protein [Roseibaca domitiana]